MILGRLEDVLDNLGPGIHDVNYYDSNGMRLDENDLKEHDFDNIKVIEKCIQKESVNTDWVIMNITLEIKKQST